MACGALVASVEFLAPEVEEGERGFGVADFVSQIIRHAAVGVDRVEVRTEALGEKPGGYVEIFIVGFGEAAAPGAGFFEGGRMVGDAVAGGQG
jgi:hypothetical protein